jgi:hypothetical protein
MCTLYRFVPLSLQKLVTLLLEVIAVGILEHLLLQQKIFCKNKTIILPKVTKFNLKDE